MTADGFQYFWGCGGFQVGQCVLKGFQWDLVGGWKGLGFTFVPINPGLQVDNAFQLVNLCGAFCFIGGGIVDRSGYFFELIVGELPGIHQRILYFAQVVHHPVGPGRFGQTAAEDVLVVESIHGFDGGLD